MKTMLLLVGFPGSGKTHYANDLMQREPDANDLMQREPDKWVRINWDDLRIKNHHDPKKFSYKKEDAMKAESRELVREAVAAGFSVIIDNTNLNASTRNSWLGLAQELGMNFKIHDMNEPLLTAIWRDRVRPGRLGRAVIETMALFSDRIDFHKDEKIVIVDMDGTLANCSHRRHFVTKPNCNWDAFESYEEVMKDPPFPVIVEWVKALRWHYTVLIVSGRQISRAGIATEDWLEKHGIQYQHLFMRNGPGPDYEIKQKILDRLPKDQIAFCIDDRDQVVAQWRKNGLTVYQVAEGNF